MTTLFRNVLYPAWHWVRRDGVNRAVRELEQNQWLSAAALQELQQRKLADLLAFAARHVPYYRALWQQFGFRTEPADITQYLDHMPILSKRTIREQQDALLSENLAGNRLLRKNTSGSTGEALHFYMDQRSLPYRKAAEFRSDTWTGWQLGERIARLWGAPMDQRRDASLRGRLHGLVTGNLTLNSFDLSESSMDKYLEAVRAFRPVLLVSYPGPLEQFALHCRDRGVRFPSLRGIASSAETLWPPQRDRIEQAFGVKVFDRYGCREVGQIGSECPAHEGLHISAERVMIEVVDDSGRACLPGEVGRIIVTDLDNFGMPFIRYEIGDRGALAEPSPCSCGRGLPRLEKVEGRTLDVVRTAGGRRIGGTFWTLLLRSRAGIRQFQVIQNRLEGVEIRFVREPGFDEAVKAHYVRTIKEHCGPEFEVDFIEVESIALTESGKRRLIISRLDQAQQPTQSTRGRVEGQKRSTP